MKNKSLMAKLMRTMLSILTLALATNQSYAEDNVNWDKTFTSSDKVIHEKVSYPNR